jgi:hypothetical protein
MIAFLLLAPAMAALETAQSPEPCVPGEDVLLSIWSDEDLSATSFEWHASANVPSDSLDAEGSKAALACPDCADPDAIYSVYAILVDEDGNQHWVFFEISVQCDWETTAPRDRGCATAHSESLAAVFLLGLLGLSRRETWSRSAGRGRTPPSGARPVFPKHQAF